MTKPSAALRRENPIDLHWGRYGAKMAFALVWLLTAVPAYSGMMDRDLPAAGRLVLTGVFCLPAAAWIATVSLRLRRRDEFEVDLLTKGLARAAIFCVGWLVAVLGARVVTDIVDPDGSLATGLIAVIPPLMMAMAESNVQLERRRIARG